MLVFHRYRVTNSCGLITDQPKRVRLGLGSFGPVIGHPIVLIASTQGFGKYTVSAVASPDLAGYALRGGSS
jgi:hypothetical protein